MKRQIFVLVALAAFATSCSNNTTSPTMFTPVPAGPSTVLVPNQTTGFTPPTLAVSVGTTVTWGNNDTITHTSTADAGQWDSSTFGSGQTFTHKFDTAGSFKYHCTIHPGMTGTIVVQ